MPAPPPRSPGGVPVLLLACTVLAALNFTQAISTIYLQSHGVALGAIFSLESVMLGAMLVAEVPSGHLSDRFGPRRLVIAAFGAQFASQTVFAIADSYAGFAVASVLFGVSLAALSGAREIYVMELRAAQGEQRHGPAHSFARLNQAMLVGGLVSAGVGGQLATMGLAVPVRVTAVFAGLGFVLSWFLPDGTRAVPADASGAGGSVRTALAAIRRSPVLIFFSALPQFALLSAINPILQPRLLSEGVTLAHIGWIIAGGTLVAVVMSQLTRRLEGWLGLERAYAVSLACGAAGYVVASFSGAVTVVVGSYVIAVALSLCLPMSGALKVAAAPGGAQATTLSVSSFCGSLVAIVANLAIGALTDVSVEAALRAVAVTIVVAVLLWTAAVRVGRRAERVQEVPVR
ncbi:MFS transporter [Cellulomonas sp. 179-A 9B4 NHS]|uniref:MFS transporter n=1 Tax=Cellulomonas sp. 179-A 9B4 NHS TaxID=3142379 RepID=UPI00399FFDFA